MKIKKNIKKDKEIKKIKTIKEKMAQKKSNASIVIFT